MIKIKIMGWKEPNTSFLKEKRALPNSQRHLVNIYLINNVEDVVLFKFEKGLILSISSILFLQQKCASNFTEKPQLENDHLLKRI